MNLLFTITKNYIAFLISTLRSIADSSKDEYEVYIMSSDCEEEDILKISKNVSNQFHFHLISVPKNEFQDAPTSKRYPSSIYYRLFASLYLPKDLDRILYLDPDIIVLKSFRSLYHMEFKGNYYICTTNVKKNLAKFDEIKNKAPKDSPYPNTGILLMNLPLLRKVTSKKKIYQYIEKNKMYFTLPDQDIVQGLYGDKLYIVSSYIYNMNDRLIKRNNSRITLEKIDNEWIEKYTIILHYYGRNKPWKKNYKGILKKYYDKYAFVEE